MKTLSKFLREAEELSFKKPSKTPLSSIKEIIFVPGSPMCIKCLDEHRKQQVINEKVYDQKLMYDTVKKMAWNRL